MQSSMHLSTEGRYLLVNGKKTVLVGDSVTQGWMELGTNFNTKAYLDALASRGCTVVMLWSYIGIVDQLNDARVGYDAPELWPWVRNGQRFDLTKRNRQYFDRLGQFVKYAAQHGIVVIITIHDGWTKSRFGGHPFNAALGGPLAKREQYIDLHDYSTEMPSRFNKSWDWKQINQFAQEQFCQWLIDATSGYGNVIYEIFNEGEWYDPKRMELYQTHFLSFFRRRTKCLLMVDERTKLKANKNCDLFSWHQPNVTADMSAAVSFNFYTEQSGISPNKPLFFSEPVPEYVGDSTDDQAIMRLMWGTVLAGAGFVVQNDCSFGFDPHCKMAKCIKQRDHVMDMEGHCARFMQQLDLSGMKPHGAKSSSGVCLAATGRQCVVYTQQRELTVDLSDFNDTVMYRCFNPLTGAYTPWVSCQAQSKVLLNTGTSDDRVLQIKK
ncbi:MAG: glycoside hydrolase family protein [Armatimonadota bacterium]